MKFSTSSLGALLLVANSVNVGAFLVRPCANLRMQQDRGWDNDDYMNALSSGSSSDMDKANAKYFKQSDARMGAYKRRMQANGDDNESILFGGKSNVEGVPDKLPKAPPIDEDNPSGGEMFRKLMERAEAQKNGMGGRDPSEMSRASPTPTDPVAQQQPQAPSPPVAPAGADVQQQTMQEMQQQMMQMMQKMQEMQQPGAVSPASAPLAQVQEPEKDNAIPNVPAEGVQTDVMQYAPKPLGGKNRDAYEINNSADVYFAQLKRDSNVRNIARKSGDFDSANAVFVEEGTKKLSKYFSDEVVQKRREQSKDMYSTSRDEMVIPYEEDTETDEEKEKKKTYSGVSYRDIMAKKKQNKAASSVPSSMAAPTPTIEPPKKVDPPVVVPVVVEPVAETPTAPEPVSVKPVVAEPVAVEVVAETPTVLKPESVEPEAEKPLAPEPESPKLKAESDAIRMATPSTEDSDEIRSSLRTLQGLILKHRGGPGFGAGQLKAPEALKLEDTLAQVTSMLRKEAGIADEVTETTAPKSTSSSSLQGAISCVEAAVKMYQMAANDEEEKLLLLPVRNALLSTVSAINKAVAEMELEQQPLKAQTPPTMDFPATYAVTKLEEEIEKQSNVKVSQQSESSIQTVTNIKEKEEQTTSVAAADPISISNEVVSDSNTIKMQKTYDVLKSCSGDSKLGLKELNQDEIAKLKEAIDDMRGALMEELDIGIPVSTATADLKGEEASA